MSDRRAGRNKYEITYIGKDGLNIKVTKDFALLRAANLCLQIRKPYFGLLSGSSYWKAYDYIPKKYPVTTLKILCSDQHLGRGTDESNAVRATIQPKLYNQSAHGYKSIIMRDQKGNQP